MHREKRICFLIPVIEYSNNMAEYEQGIMRRLLYFLFFVE